jgi:hypothetical protein
VQEKTQGQERRVQELEDALEKMRMERDSLETRNALLEAAARMKPPTMRIPEESKVRHSTALLDYQPASPVSHMWLHMRHAVSLDKTCR